MEDNAHQILTIIREDLKTIKEENFYDHKEIKVCLTEHNGRLKQSELWRERIIGIFIGISVLVSIFTFILGGVIFPFLVKAITK